MILVLILLGSRAVIAAGLSVLRWRERLDGTDADWLDWPAEDWRTP